MDRPRFVEAIRKGFKTHPVVAILGPRQCGKTTLSQLYVEEEGLKGKAHFFDLEDPADLASLSYPKGALEPLDQLIVLDEVQRLPELFPLLRVLVDKKKKGQRFLLLGSASRELLRQSSESLAGRIAYIELTPFSLREVDDPLQLWVRGGFPKAYLAESIEDSSYWRKQYISTFLERDLPNLGVRIAPLALRRFWMMLTHYHGQLFNGSEIGKSLGVSDTTVRHYLDVLTATFMVRQLLPWFENISKRQVKRPKIYFRDSGLYHSLQEIGDFSSLLHHPRLGASWEGFALEEVTRFYGAAAEECFFWAIHGQAELDLLLVRDGKRMGFECKYCDAPRLTKSMQIALDTLQLDRLYVIYPGSRNYLLSEKVEVVSLYTLAESLSP